MKGTAMSKLKSKKVAGIFGAALLAAGLAVGLGVKLPSVGGIAPGTYTIVGVSYNLAAQTYELDLAYCALKDGTQVTGEEIYTAAIYAQGEFIDNLKSVFDAACKPVGTVQVTPTEAGENGLLNEYVVE